MMGRRTVLVCLLALGSFLGLLFWNDNNVYTELTFSKQSGFYEELFELELYAPVGTEIYYTLDGSEPDENAIKYTRPILINDATGSENIYSLRTDVSAGFLTENIAAYSTLFPDPNYVVPDYNVDKCTVIRAVCLDADGNFSKIKTESYFVGYENKAGYDGLNIISIVTAPDNLFHYDTGIYVLGHTYDEYVDDERESFLETPYWCWWNANYRQHGFEWERAASIQLFNEQRGLILNQECGIRIHGGASRAILPKSINLYAREQYDENSRFYRNLFGTDYLADTMTLFSGGEDTESKFRDMFVSELMKDREFATMNFKPYAMFLDGEYWGIYWLTEKYDDVFLEYYYGVEKDNVIMIKNNSLAEGKEEDYELYREMMDYMTDTDFSDRENYECACDMLDIQSFIDYFATQIYIGRSGDWPGGNTGIWRSRETGSGKYEDGKWRWMLFDVYSTSLSAYITDIDTLGRTMDESVMFNNLCKSDEFKRQFIITFMDIANTSFDQKNVDNIIADYLSMMTEPIYVNNRRFFGTEDSKRFLDTMVDIQEFLDHRKRYIVQYIKDDFELTGSPVLVQVEISNVSAGSVIVNTAEIVFNDEAKWSGEYYTDFPITLAAAANQGYRFVGWESAVVSDEESIEIDLDEEGILIKAVFEELY